jgi:hypothetical protein
VDVVEAGGDDECEKGGGGTKAAGARRGELGETISISFPVWTAALGISTCALSGEEGREGVGGGFALVLELMLYSDSLLG